MPWQSRYKKKAFIILECNGGQFHHFHLLLLLVSAILNLRYSSSPFYSFPISVLPFSFGFRMFFFFFFFLEIRYLDLMIKVEVLNEKESQEIKLHLRKCSTKTRIFIQGNRIETSEEFIFTSDYFSFTTSVVQFVFIHSLTIFNAFVKKISFPFILVTSIDKSSFCLLKKNGHNCNYSRLNIFTGYPLETSFVFHSAAPPFWFILNHFNQGCHFHLLFIHHVPVDSSSSTASRHFEIHPVRFRSEHAVRIQTFARESPV